MTVYAILIALLLAALIPTLIYSFALFDRLIRAEYTDNHAVWEKDGRPRGLFWRPAECGRFDILSGLARLRLHCVWLFSTPVWISQSPILHRCLRRARLGVLIWNLGMTCVFVLLFKTGFFDW
jgi:hypothetical protein